MGKESVIISFIRENLKTLQQKEFPEEVYKLKKHEYFIKHKRILGKPKDPEIAKITISYLINKNLLKTEATLTKFLNLPFFKKNIFDVDIFYEELKLKNLNSNTIINPSEIGKAEYATQIEQEIKDKVISASKKFLDEQNKQVQDQIEQKKKELESIPTRLDEVEIVEPEITKSDKEMREWWQILNLREDPIPIQEGFQKIDADYYDDIVVHTDIFNQYVNYSNNLPDQIFKNTIFYGEFGSGKTSFFDYLKQILSRNKILLVYVPIWPSIDAEKIILDFKTDLIASLNDESKKFGTNLEHINSENHDQTIKKLLEELQLQHNFKGFVIVVDDLHKHDKAFDAVVLFLSSLQIFISKLTRGSKFNATAYVAGKPSWKSKIQSEPSLSGSLIREEEMPEITVSHAYSMLNKRMVAFSINPEKKNIVGNTFVKEVYDELNKNNKIITFRTFLQKALDEFKMSNFDKVVTINPNAISIEIIENVKERIKQSSKLNSQFEVLLSLIQNNNEETQQSCFECLGTLYLEKKMYESNHIWERNKWRLGKLRDAGLIINHEDEDGCYWSITKEIRMFNEKIINQYGVSLEEYLIRVFFTTTVKKPRKTSYPELQKLKKIEKSCTENNYKKIIQYAINDYKKFLDINEKQVIDITPGDLVNNCITVMASLTRAFMLLNGIPKIVGNDIDILDFWTTFWKKPSPIIEFIDNVESSKKLDSTVANYIFGICREAIQVTISFMEDQIAKNRIFQLSYENLTNEDCEKIDLCRTCWSDGDYYGISEVISDYLEKKIRQNIFNIFKLFYGSVECRYKRYPNAITQVMKNKIAIDQKRGMSKIVNELQFLDRGEYKILMTRNTDENYSKHGEMNWNEVFKTIFSPWDQVGLLKFLDRFANINISVAHNKTESIGRQNQPEIRSYLMDAIFVIQKINSSYDKIFKNGVKTIKSKHYFGFKKKLDTMVIDDVSPKTERTRGVIDALKKMEQIDVNLEDPNYLESLYSVDYREFVLILNWLLNASSEDQTRLGSTLVIKNEKSPEYIFKFVENITSTN